MGRRRISRAMPLSAERRRAQRLNRIEAAAYILCVLTLIAAVVAFAQI
jgi:hypothetical protein